MADAQCTNERLDDDRFARARRRFSRRGGRGAGLAHLSPLGAEATGSPPQAARVDSEAGSTHSHDGEIVEGRRDLAASTPDDAVVADSGIRVVVSPASPRVEPNAEPSASKHSTGALFCAIDTETTGLNTQLDRVIEIAALFDDRQLVQLGLQDVDLPRYFQALVRPDVKIPDKASAIHGILDSHVAHSQAFGKVRFELSQWLDNWHQASGLDLILVAHNAAYDRDILMQETRRHCGQRADLHRRAKWSCTLSAFRRRVRWRNAGLPALVKEYLPAHYQHSAHRALGDCRALLDVLHALPQEIGIWDELRRSQTGNARS